MATTQYDRSTDGPFSSAQDALLLALKTANPNQPWKEIGAELDKPHWACKNRYKQLMASSGAEERQQEVRDKQEKSKGNKEEFELENTDGWTKDEVGLLNSSSMFLPLRDGEAGANTCVARLAHSSGLQGARQHVVTGCFAVSRYHKETRRPG